MDDAIVLGLFGSASSQPLVARLVSVIAEYGILLLVLGLVLLWLLPASGVPFRRTVLFAVVPSFVVAVFLAVGFSLFLYRARPFEVLGIQPLFAHYADSSFPSDHMLFGSALIGPAVWSRPKLGIWLLVWLLVIGACRVAAGVHYASDILGSILLGAVPTGIAVQLVALLERASPRR
jgi:undecaprenyl-diphosphatase